MSDNGCDKDNKMAAIMEAIAMHVMALRAPDKMAVITIASTVFGSFCFPFEFLQHLILILRSKRQPLEQNRIYRTSNTTLFPSIVISGFWCNRGT